MRHAAALSIAFALCAAWPCLAASTPREEANKAVVLDFYDKALNQKDVAAASAHLGPRYIQHNPRAEDGIDGFAKFIRFRSERFPHARSEIKRVIAEDDMVVLHVYGTNEPGDRGSAIIDIFRLENGKIVEHWDAIQPVPDSAANANGMF